MSIFSSASSMTRDLTTADLRMKYLSPQRRAGWACKTITTVCSVGRSIPICFTWSITSSTVALSQPWSQCRPLRDTQLSITTILISRGWIRHQLPSIGTAMLPLIMIRRAGDTSSPSMRVRTIWKIPNSRISWCLSCSFSPSTQPKSKLAKRFKTSPFMKARKTAKIIQCRCRLFQLTIYQAPTTRRRTPSWTKPKE